MQPRYKLAWLKDIQKALEDVRAENNTMYGRETTGDSKIPAMLQMAVADRQKQGYDDDLLGFKSSKKLQDWARHTIKEMARARIDVRREKDKRELNTAMDIASMATTPTMIAKDVYDYGRLGVDAYKAFKNYKKLDSKAKKYTAKIRERMSEPQKQMLEMSSNLAGSPVSAGLNIAKKTVKDHYKENPNLIAKDSVTIGKIPLSTYSGLQAAKGVIQKGYERTPLGKALPYINSAIAAGSRSVDTNKKIQAPEKFNRQGYKDFFTGKSRGKQLVDSAKKTIKEEPLEAAKLAPAVINYGRKKESVWKLLSLEGQSKLAEKKKPKGTATKRDPAKWEAAKRQAKAKMGGKHSARAMQLATQIYKKKGGTYKGKKPTAKNNKLKKWTKQKWQWSGERKKKSSYDPNFVQSVLERTKEAGKGVYLPAKSIDALKSSKKGRSKLRAASRKKTEATNKGQQFSSHGLHKGKKRSKLG